MLVRYIQNDILMMPCETIGSYVLSGTDSRLDPNPNPDPASDLDLEPDHF